MKAEKITVGLEVHAYLNVGKQGSKLFCDCPAQYKDVDPNVNVCPICTGMPGSKPMLPNKLAVEKVIAIGLLLGCDVQKKLVFQRKHYNYPDLPNGYQKTISGSYSTPVAVKGGYNGMGIWEVHLEEDPAKWDPRTGEVDYNRCGVPLIEIVTAPEQMTVEEVREWLRGLVTLLHYIDALPENTGIKADVNVNVQGHPRVEVKNVNSFWSIVRAIEYEAERQKKVLEEGTDVEPETRGWREDQHITVSMRKKEGAKDYRFIPEPDLPMILVNDAWVQKIQKSLPESPDEKTKRFVKEYGLTPQDAGVLTNNLELAALYEAVANGGIDARFAMKWLRRDVLRLMDEEHLEHLTLDKEQTITLLFLLQEGSVTDVVGRRLLKRLMRERFDVEQEVRASNLGVISDDSELRKLCEEVVQQHPGAVQDFLSGKQQAFDFLVGQVMYRTKGRADHGVVAGLIKDLVGPRSS